MSTTSSTREAFEAWYRASHTSAILRRSANGYIDNTTRVAWRAWQAAHPKPWQGLTPEDKKRILANDFGGNRADCMDAAEKILREKNA